MQGKSLYFYWCAFACELQIAGFVRELIVSVQWSLGRSTSSSHGCGLQTSEFGDSVVPRGGFVTLLCVTACPRQPSPCFREWLVLAFSLSRVAELELFALWVISLALVQSALSSGRAQLPAPIPSRSKLLNHWPELRKGSCLVSWSSCRQRWVYLECFFNSSPGCRD